MSFFTFSQRFLELQRFPDVSETTYDALNFISWPGPFWPLAINHCLKESSTEQKKGRKQKGVNKKVKAEFFI